MEEVQLFLSPIWIKRPSSPTVLFYIFFFTESLFPHNFNESIVFEGQHGGAENEYNQKDIKHQFEIHSTYLNFVPGEDFDKSVYRSQSYYFPELQVKCLDDVFVLDDVQSHQKCGNNCNISDQLLEIKNV